MRQRLEAFMQRYLLPYNAAWHASVQAGVFPPPFLDDLKTLAREEGLWNLFLPTLGEGDPGTRLSNLDYAPLAEVMGRLPWAAEVFNCSAPDTGNMELLHRFATPEQRAQWLQPLLQGHMRSAFAMSEPDVASSDPTNLQTTVRRESDQLVLHGRKWFITGAAHPHCKLLIVMCRNMDTMLGVPNVHQGVDASADSAQPSNNALAPADSHHQHSMVLVPLDTPGVQVLRNISVVHHHAPEGHCEIVLRDVRVSMANLLGTWGEDAIDYVAGDGATDELVDVAYEGFGVVGDGIDEVFGEGTAQALTDGADALGQDALALAEDAHGVASDVVGEGVDALDSVIGEEGATEAAIDSARETASDLADGAEAGVDSASAWAEEVWDDIF